MKTVQAVGVFTAQVFILPVSDRQRDASRFPVDGGTGNDGDSTIPIILSGNTPPTCWIISRLCRCCRGVGKEWQHHTLLKRDGEQLALLKVSHICIKYQPASSYCANIYCKAKRTLQTTKEYAFFPHLLRQKLIEIDSGKEARQRRTGIWWRQRIKEHMVEATSQMFSVKTLICKALPEVGIRRGRSGQSGFATGMCFSCLHEEARPIKSPDTQSDADVSALTFASQMTESLQ